MRLDNYRYRAERIEPIEGIKYAYGIQPIKKDGKLYMNDMLDMIEIVPNTIEVYDKHKGWIKSK